MRKTASVGTLKRLMRLVGRRSVLLALTLMLAVVYVVSSVMIPVLVGNAVDFVVGAGNVNHDAVFRVLVQILVLTFVSAAAQYLMSLINNRLTYSTVADLRKMAFEKIQSLPFSFLDKTPTGDIVSRVISDAEQVGDGLLTGATQLFTGAATIVATLVMMLINSPIIAAVVVLVTPLSLIAARLVAKKTYGYFREQAELRGDQTAYTNEMIVGQKTVRIYSMHKKTQSTFEAGNEKLRAASLRATFWSSLTNPVTRFVNSVVYAVVALTGALTAISNPAFTVGMLTRMLAYANQYTKPFNEISGVITELQGAFAAAERIFALIDSEPEPQEADAVIECFTGKVSLQNVSFSYSSERKLIENLSLDITPGMKVAIVGPTGCGKTTLINLLMRFYDVNDGSIKADGVDIRDIRRASLRSGYGMVLQETWLMPGTVRENIAMGNPEASYEEIVEAAKKAHAHDFIKRLPNGYDTEIGDATMLSEGERQLLCIARVMLVSPPMLILDEATSSIDTRTEIKIKECFDRMTVGRTSFMVAHRLSTIMNADMILVMKNGHVIEKGTHEELLAANGFYSELWNA